MDRQLYIDAIRGTNPSYETMELPLVDENGSYVGGFHDRWDWNHFSITELSDEELIRLYELARDKF